jgi:kinesin family protein 1
MIDFWLHVSVLMQDLLNISSKSKGGMKIREHPKKGFYVESLTLVPVGNYREIQDRIDEV